MSLVGDGHAIELPVAPRPPVRKHDSAAGRLKGVAHRVSLPARRVACSPALGEHVVDNACDAAIGRASLALVLSEFAATAIDARHARPSGASMAPNIKSRRSTSFHQP
jgi:hypothetical protein